MIAESDDVTEADGRTYFPADSVDMSLLTETDTSSRCYWKGTARYWDVEAGGEVAADGAFAYPEPLEKASPDRHRPHRLLERRHHRVGLSTPGRLGSEPSARYGRGIGTRGTSCHTI